MKGASFWTFLLCFFGFIVLSISVEYPSQARWIHNIKRRSITAESVEAELFWTEKLPYYSSISAFVIVPIVIGGIALLCSGCFCCLRFCGKFCTGENEIVSSRKRNALRVTIIILSLTFLGLLGGGIAGNSSFVGTLDLFDWILELAPAQREKVESIRPILQLVNPNRTAIKHYIDIVHDQGDDFTNNAQSSSDSFHKYNNYRVALLAVTYGVGALTAVLGIAGALWRQPVVVLLASILSYVSMFLLWSNIGVHVAISAIQSDLCFDVAEYTIPNRIQQRIDDEGEHYPKSAMDSIVKCTSYTSTVKTYNFTLELIHQVEEELLLINSTLQHPDNDTDIEYWTEQQEEKADELARLEMALDDCMELRRCDWLLDVFAPYETKICNTYLLGGITIWATSFVSCLLFIPFTVVTAIAGYAFKASSSEGFF